MARQPKTLQERVERILVEARDTWARVERLLASTARQTQHKNKTQPLNRVESAQPEDGT